MHDEEINEYVQLGLANREVIELARNWCAHLEVERTGGVGLIEQETGLPIGFRSFLCKHATGTTISAMDLRHVALHFYDNNCDGCPHRAPVRLPNLTKIVSERDRAVAEQAKREQHEEEMAAAALAERHTARLEIRDGAPPSTAGIIDLIAELDTEYTEDAHARLGKLAGTVPQQFDTKVQGLLLALVDAGGEGRTRAALEALVRTDAPRRDLTAVALRALARHEAVELAGDIVAEHLDATHKELIEPALPALFVLASPTREPFAPRLTPKVAALQKAYTLYPDACDRVLQKFFATDHELTRVVAAGSWEVLIALDGDIGPRIAPDAIHSLSLRDERLGVVDGARRATAHALAEAMKHRTGEMDAILQDAYARGVARDVLLDAYAEVCAANDTRRIGTPAPMDTVRLAFSRLSQAILEPNLALDELRTVLNFLRSEAKDREDLLVENAGALLGILALLIDRIDELKIATSPLAIGTPDPLTALEKRSRLTLLGGILNSLSSLLGLALKTDLGKVLPLLKDVLDNTPSEKEHLRSYVVRMLTGAAHDRAALVDLLPYIYGALADNSPRVRTAAVAAYGVIAKHGIDDLPPLLNELVTGLLLDPYVVVHLAVVEVLKELRLPEPYRTTAIASLAQLVHVYGTTSGNDSSTRACIEAYTTQYGRPIPPKTADRLIAIARAMDPDQAVKTLLDLASYVPDEEAWIAATAEYAAAPNLSEFERHDALRVLMRSDASLLAKHADHLHSAVLLRLSELPFPRTFGDDDFLEVFVERLMLAAAWPTARAMLAAAEQHFGGATLTHGRQKVTALQLAALDVEEADEPDQRLALARQWRDDPANEKLDTAAVIGARFDGLLALGTRDVTLLTAATDAVKASAPSIEDAAIRREYMTFARVLEAIQYLVRWRDAARGAEMDAERFRRAAVLAGREIQKEQGRFVEAGVAERLTTIADVEEIDDLAAAALSVRLPLPLSKDPYPYRPGTPPIGSLAMTKTEGARALSVMFVRFEFEGRPVDDPQVIAPGTLHEFTVDVSLSDWPEGADAIVIDTLSVVPRSSYEMPTFTLKRTSGPRYHWRETGHLVLHHPQSLETGPLDFQYRAYATPESGAAAISLEGQRSVRLFAYDPAMHPQTGFADIDRKLLAIRTEVRRANVPEADIAPFMRMMTALGSIAGRALSSHLFPGHDWPEKRFQAEVGDKLRTDPRIGSDLEEHPNVAAGSTDLSYKRIRTELKVEGGKAVSVEDARSYSDQEAQYVAGSDRRLGIISVLDFSKKESPPGLPSNDIGLLSIAPATGGAPLLLGVVIIRGNLRRPSDYSK